MRVVVPFTESHPEVTAAIEASGYHPELRYVGGSDTDYFALMCELWSDRETFAIVEHDIVVKPDTLMAFEACPFEWCACPYPYLRGEYAGLGCTRFRAPLMQQMPGLVMAAGERDYPNHNRRHWCTLDDAIGRELAKRATKHVHDSVAHLGDHWPKHGCRGPKPEG